MYNEVFLLVFVFIWILFASLQDLRKRIVSDWLNFSFIIFVLGFRFFYSLVDSSQGFAFFYQGLIGLGIFFVLGNFLYYARFFGGGDAKLLIALGAALPLGNSLLSNLGILASFMLIFLFVGSVYGLLWSIGVVLFSRKISAYGKEFSKQFKKIKMFALPVGILALVMIGFGMNNLTFSYFGILILILPYLYIHARVIDNRFLVRRVKTSELEEGDWIFRDLKIGKKIINPSWSGLTKVQIREIRKKYKNVLIRHGIPFVPVFLISFILVIYFHFFGVGFDFFKGFY